MEDGESVGLTFSYIGPHSTGYSVLFVLLFV